jgi:NADH-quinone oxidoreductase subunit L
MKVIELLGWIPFFPFLGFLILVLAGDRLSKPLIAWVGVGSVAVSLSCFVWSRIPEWNDTALPYGIGKLDGS